MTATGEVDPAAPAPAAEPPARRTLRPDRVTWPIWGFTAGLPVAYVLGFHGVAWCLPSVVLGVRILLSKDTRFPRSTIPLAIFVCWIALSAATIDPSDLPIYFYRYSLFAGCLMTLVWVANVRQDAVPTQRLVDWLAALWIWLIAIGYLATLLPSFHSPSPFMIGLGPVGRIDFIARISEWRFSETQDFLGYAVPRPAAPFGAANSWGSAVGILTPFFIRSWLVDAGRTRRRWGWILLVAGVYPVLISVNRGLWIALTVAIFYFAARRALRGRFGAMVVLVVAIFGVAALFLLTPAGGLVKDRIDNSADSDRSRSSLYVEAWHGALESPLVGNGVPRPTDFYPNSPPVGTHGLFWYLMFIHGFVGLFLFLGWLMVEVFRSGRLTTPLGWWTHLSLVIATVEVPYYGLLPHVLLIGIIVGISHREESA